MPQLHQAKIGAPIEQPSYRRRPSNPCLRGRSISSLPLPPNEVRRPRTAPSFERGSAPSRGLFPRCRLVRRLGALQARSVHGESHSAASSRTESSRDAHLLHRMTGLMRMVVRLRRPIAEDGKSAERTVGHKVGIVASVLAMRPMVWTLPFVGVEAVSSSGRIDRPFASSRWRENVDWCRFDLWRHRPRCGHGSRSTACPHRPPH